LATEEDVAVVAAVELFFAVSFALAFLLLLTVGDTGGLDAGDENGEPSEALDFSDSVDHQSPTSSSSSSSSSSLLLSLPLSSDENGDDEDDFLFFDPEAFDVAFNLESFDPTDLPPFPVAAFALRSENIEMKDEKYQLHI
jgi:hypothetical protein